MLVVVPFLRSPWLLSSTTGMACSVLTGVRVRFSFDRAEPIVRTVEQASAVFRRHSYIKVAVAGVLLWDCWREWYAEYLHRLHHDLDLYDCTS